jgi:hypothetical protein
MQSHDFSCEQLLATLRGAEQLTARSEDLAEGREQMHLKPCKSVLFWG